MEVCSRLQVRVVDSCEEFHLLKQCWGDILGKLEEFPPFLSWEWMYTWWEVYKTNATNLLVLVISDNSQIIAIVPFYVRRRSFPIPCNTVYFLGTGEPESKEVCSEYLNFISIPTYSKVVSRKVVSYFAANNKIWDRICLHRILDKSDILDFFVQDAVERKYITAKKFIGLRYFIILPDHWEQYLQTLRSSMRRSILVAQKRFLGESECKIEAVEDESQINTYMQELIKLHTESWRTKGKPGAFASREFCEFHLKIAKLLFKNNMLQMLKVSVKNEIVAILYNYKVMNSVYYYQSGLNMQKFASHKPGVLLHSEAIKNAIKKKMKIYDFMMAGQNTYKSQYACETSEMFHISVWNKGLRHRMLQKLALIPYFK